MNEKQMIFIGALVVAFIAFLVVVNLLDNKSLNGIKAKKVGDGQHGTNAGNKIKTKAWNCEVGD